MRARKAFNFIGATLLFVSVGSAGASANLLIDGNFDNPTFPVAFPFYENYGPVGGDPHYGGTAFDSAWQITVGNVDLVQQSGGWPAPPQSSPYYLDLNGNTNGAIQQSFGTTLGQKYNLSFYYSNNPGGSPHPAEASVQVGSINGIVMHDGATTSDLSWKFYSNSFIANAPLMTLSFAELDNCCNGGVLLDTISMSAIPESSTWAMVILGFAGVGLLAYRRKNKAAFRFA
jgi:hypothetical protein